MKLEMSDNQSNHSDFSSDSQSSQGSSVDFASTVPTSRPLLSVSIKKYICLIKVPTQIYFLFIAIAPSNLKFYYYLGTAFFGLLIRILIYYV